MISYDEPGVTYDDSRYTYDGNEVQVSQTIRPVYWRGFGGSSQSREEERRRKSQNFSSVFIEAQLLVVNGEHLDLDVVGEPHQIRFAGLDDEETKVEARARETSTLANQYQVEAAPIESHPREPLISSILEEDGEDSLFEEIAVTAIPKIESLVVEAQHFLGETITVRCLPVITKPRPSGPIVTLEASLVNDPAHTKDEDKAR